MRRPRYLVFDCPACGLTTERFVETTDANEAIEAQRCDNATLFPADDAQPAGYCRADLVQRDIGGAPLLATINKHNSDFSERQTERLQKRADDHWKRQGRDEAVDRERALVAKYDKQSGL